MKIKIIFSIVAVLIIAVVFLKVDEIQNNFLQGQLSFSNTIVVPGQDSFSGKLR